MVQENSFQHFNIKIIYSGGLDANIAGKDNKYPLVVSEGKLIKAWLLIFVMLYIII